MRPIDGDTVDKVIYEEIPLAYFCGRSLTSAPKNVAFIRERIAQIPTLDAVPVVHGRWHDSDFVPGLLSCSICGAQRNPNFKIGGGRWDYCPNCGAKMDRERRESNG